MAIAVSYFLVHVFSFLYLDRRFRSFYIWIGFVLMFYVQFGKGMSYDLLSYVRAMSYIGSFEFGFAFLGAVLQSLFVDEQLVVMLMQIVLGFLFVVPLLLLRSEQFKFVDSLFFLVLSLAFFLGTNNALRQAYSSVFLVVALIYASDKRYVFAILFVVMSQLFHSSGIAFALFSLLIVLSPSVMIAMGFRSERLVYLFILIVALSVYLLISVIAPITGYDSYLAKDMSMNADRTVLWAKFIIIFAVLLLSEYFVDSPSFPPFIANLRLLRVALIMLVGFMSLSPGLNEVGSRILYFYFVIEAYYMACLIQEGQNYPGFIVLVSYAFAPNAYNILLA